MSEPKKRKQREKSMEDRLGFEKFVSERQMPYSKETEQAVLGAILFDKDAIDKVRRFLKDVNTFYFEEHRIIYKAILNLASESLPIDTLTVTAELRKTEELEKVGGAYTIVSLTMNIASTANIETHTMILFQYYIRRTLATYSMNLFDICTDLKHDEFSTFDEAVLKLDSIKNQVVSMKETDFKEQVEVTINEIMDEMNGKVLPILTGFKDFDELVGGRIKGESAIIAARTSMGKTSRMLKEVMNVALTENKKVGIISLEMKASTLIKKILSNMARVDSALFRSRGLSLSDIDKLYTSSEILKDYNILIHDTSGVNVSDIKATARKWKSHGNLDILYIDYLTLIRHQNPFKTSTHEEVGKISQGIKELAMELNIPIVTLAQINRSPEARTEKRPELSDLKSSGDIEQDADVISILYRPEYYGILQDEQGNSLKGIMEESIKKNRNSRLGTVRYRFMAEINEFDPVSFEGKHIDITQPKITEDVPF